MIPMLLFGLSGLWLVFDIIWILVIIIRKKRKVHIPQEIKFQIKKTMRLNMVYVIIFMILGFLFL